MEPDPIEPIEQRATAFKLCLSQEEVDLVDSVRGSVSRGLWVRLAVLWAVREFADVPRSRGLQLPVRSKGTTRVNVAFRIGVDELAEIDRARGSHTRAGWIRSVALRVAAGELAGRWSLPPR